MLEIEPEVVGEEDEFTYVYDENPYIGLDNTYDQVPDGHFDELEGQVRKSIGAQDNSRKESPKLDNLTTEDIYEEIPARVSDKTTDKIRPNRAAPGKPSMQNYDLHITADKPRETH